MASLNLTLRQRKLLHTIQNRKDMITGQELAGLLNLSVRQTQRLLLSHFCKTFSQKITEARMAAASQFLNNTRLSITEIAEQLGFSSIEHFSSAFHRYMGCSPSAYRKGERPVQPGKGASKADGA